MCSLRKVKPGWEHALILLLFLIPIFLFFSQVTITQESLENTEKQLKIIRLSNGISSYAKRVEGHLLMYYIMQEESDRAKFFARHASMVKLIEEITPLFTNHKQRKHLPVIRQNSKKILTLGSMVIESLNQGGAPDNFDMLSEFYTASSTLRKEGVLIVDVTTKLLKEKNRLFEKEHKYSNYLLLFAYILSLCLLTAVYVLFRRFCEAKEKAEIARKEAEQSNDAKTEFLASMSHDLRTPLNAIIGFSDIMKAEMFGPMANPRYAGYVEDISNCGNLLVSLIDDILEISKIESGKYPLSEENLDIAFLTQNSINMLTTMAEAENVQLTTNFRADLPRVRGDKKAIMQILNNLLSNAVKFTPRNGQVSISAEMNGDDSMSILVVDTGEGMSRDQVIKALKPFEQAHTTYSKRHKGNGLGLYICQNLMGLHGGSLEIKSEVAKGTTVLMHFPPERIAHAA